VSGKTVKKTNYKKAAGNILPGAIDKVSEEYCLTLLTQRIANIFEPGDWPKEIPRSTTIAVKYIEAKIYEMQRPLHSQFHLKYSKESS
jgi:hypothetical protein